MFRAGKAIIHCQCRVKCGLGWSGALGESGRETACAAGRAEQVGAMLAAAQEGGVEEITGAGIWDGAGPAMKMPLLSCHV